MLNDFSWNMTGYIPKHAVNPSDDGIPPYVAERIFQLEPEPVSYTHLDVYKRQSIGSTAVCLWGREMRGAVAGDITSPVFAAIQCRIPAHRQAPIPVSYTHLLDVKGSEVTCEKGLKIGHFKNRL